MDRKVNKMEKEFVPYELAIKLKELGFDESCAMYWRPEMDGSMQIWYHQDERFDDAIGSQNSDDAEWVTCTAPLYQQAFKFFREKYNLVSWIRRRAGFYKEYSWYISNFNNEDPDEYEFDLHIESYEAAEQACLEKLIEIVESEKIKNK